MSFWSPWMDIIYNIIGSRKNIRYSVLFNEIQQTQLAYADYANIEMIRLVLKYAIDTGRLVVLNDIRDTKDPLLAPGFPKLKSLAKDKMLQQANIVFSGNEVIPSKPQYDFAKDLNLDTSGTKTELHFRVIDEINKMFTM